MKVKELHKEERPREKALNYGVESLSNVELLAVLLRSGVRGDSVFDIGEKLLLLSNGIENLMSLRGHELRKIRGISVAKSLELLACFELYKRVAFQRVKQLPKIYHASDIIEWLKLELGYQSQEQFLVIFLNTKNCIIRYQTIFIGSLHSCMVHPREIFKEAIACSSASIIAVHNHPSSDPTPSKEDINVTKQLREAGKLVGVHVLDHIIVSSTGYVSLQQEDLL